MLPFIAVVSAVRATALFFNFSYPPAVAASFSLAAASSALTSSLPLVNVAFVEAKDVFKLALSPLTQAILSSRDAAAAAAASSAAKIAAACSPAVEAKYSISALVATILALSSALVAAAASRSAAA